MSTHLRIDPLRIKDHGDVRLIKSDPILDDPNDKYLSSASDPDSDNDHVAVDVNDLEVCVIASNSSKSAPEKSVNNVLQV